MPSSQVTPPTVTLIISTYNQPDYLARVLTAVSRQTQMPDEVLLADDGSEKETEELFSRWATAQPFPARHIWFEHDGFRKSRTMNHAFAQATSDYIVCLDGDTVPHPKFIADHRAQATPGFFVQGHRALVERKAAAGFGKNGFFQDRLRALLVQRGSLNNAFRWPFPFRKTVAHLYGIRGCNFAFWHKDLAAVNGYDEAFVGWGREDSELAQRLMNAGVRRLDLRGRALCYHLWHAPAPRTDLAANDRILAATIMEKRVRCERGMSDHYPSPV